MARRLNINLASDPFRRDRPMLVASATLGVLLAGLLALLIWLASAERQQASGMRAVISRLEVQLQGLAAEQSGVEAVLRRPDNAEVLERSLMLNTLLQRKGISWTRIFSDLETVMPHNVRLMSVRPEVTPQNEILLQMVVGAQSSEPILQMLMALENSPLFGPTTLSSWLPPSPSEPLYRYRVSVNYAQKL